MHYMCMIETFVLQGPAVLCCMSIRSIEFWQYQCMKSLQFIVLDLDVCIQSVSQSINLQGIGIGIGVNPNE